MTTLFSSVEVIDQFYCMQSKATPLHAM